MSKASTWLLDYRRNVFSQSGEDGIIEKILEVISCNDKWCVEFGAWDGRYGANTRHLVESKGFSAVLIEADKKRFRELQRNYSQRDNVITINRFVGFKQDDNLDQILGTTPIPCDFDFLSIDIDGNDFHIWKSISRYRPKVVVIEFNPTIPTHIEFVQPADPSLNQGSSLLSMVKLGKVKGYELVSVLGVNAYFVKNEYYSLFQMESNTPEVLRTSLDEITYLFSGYDGQVFLRGCCRLPWIGFDLKESKFQPLPKFLRKFPDNPSTLRKILFVLYLLFTDPSAFIKRISKQIGRQRGST